MAQLNQLPGWTALLASVANQNDATGGRVDDAVGVIEVPGTLASKAMTQSGVSVIASIFRAATRNWSVQLIPFGGRALISDDPTWSYLQTRLPGMPGLMGVSITDLQRVMGSVGQTTHPFIALYWGEPPALMGQLAATYLSLGA